MSSNAFVQRDSRKLGFPMNTSHVALFHGRPIREALAHSHRRTPLHGSERAGTAVRGCGRGLVTCACGAQKGGGRSLRLVFLPCGPRCIRQLRHHPPPIAIPPPPPFFRHPSPLGGPLPRRQAPVVPWSFWVCAVWTRPADEGGHTRAPFSVQSHRRGRFTRAVMGLFKKKAPPPPPPRPSGPPPPSMEGTWQLLVTGAAAVGVGCFPRECAA